MEKTDLAISLAEMLRNVGLVNHTIWKPLKFKERVPIKRYPQQTLNVVLNDHLSLNRRNDLLPRHPYSKKEREGLKHETNVSRREPIRLLPFSNAV